MKSVDDKMLSRIFGSGRGSVFAATDFLDLGSRAAVDKVLSRLSRKGTIRRFSRGLYDYPKHHPIIGVLSPSPDAVTKALARKYGFRIQPTGPYAANLLGISDQVPARIVLLTDGASRVVRIENLEIRFRHTTLRNMATAGRTSGLVIQALRWIGPSYVGDRMIAILRSRLSDRDKKQLIADIPYAPAWVGVYMRRIARPADESPRGTAKAGS